MAARTLAESRKVFSDNLEQYVRDHPTTKALLDALRALLAASEADASHFDGQGLGPVEAQARAAIRLAEAEE